MEGKELLVASISEPPISHKNNPPSNKVCTVSLRANVVLFTVMSAFTAGEQPLSNVVQRATDKRGAAIF